MYFHLSNTLVAGRTAQAFNRRKGRQGAFWEDRYHATAIECGEHLLRCLAYMDMNMVRAGAVAHPSEWRHCGYHEIQSPPQRYRLIGREKLIALTETADDEGLRRSHGEWVAQATARGGDQRRTEWSGTVAVGNENFVVVQIKDEMGIKVRGRAIEQADDAYTLRGPKSSCILFDGEKEPLSDENSVYFDESA